MMENIEILIKKTASENETLEPNKIQQQEEQGKPDRKQEAINTALINATRNILVNGFEQMESYSGRVDNIRKVKTLTSVSTDALLISRGGIAGAVVVATRHAIAVGNSFIEQAKVDREYNHLMKLAGDISLKGSRYN